MKLKITVHGVAYEVDVEVLDAGEGFYAPPGPLPHVSGPRGAATAAAVAAPPAPAAARPGPATASRGEVASPIAGTVLEVRCKPGDDVEDGATLLVIEAMKMKTSIASPAPGRVKAVPVAAGDTVREGQILVEFE